MTADTDQARPAPTDDECETDVGFSSIAEGCNNWPCNGTPLVPSELGWRCPVCGGGY